MQSVVVSRRHGTGSCTVDVSRLKCFRCGKSGHVSCYCPTRPEQNGKGKGGEKGKQGLVRSDTWDKKGSKGVKGSKGSKGKGKKGKLNEDSESWNEDWTDWTAEGWDDDGYWWSDQWPEGCDGQWGVLQTWWDDGSGWYCDGYGYTWQQEPVQSAEMSVSHDNRSDVQKVGSVGSMIISTLFHESTCETVGSFMFEHEHELAVDSPSCESKGGCNGAELEFADMEHELAVDCKDSEFGEDDMSCGLARSCDSCTHESWICGLKSEHEVGLGDSSNLETCFDGALSRDLCASVPRKVVLVCACGWFDDHSEVSVEQQVEPYLEFLRPLLSQVADNTDASWWLLDSGAPFCLPHPPSLFPSPSLSLSPLLPSFHPSTSLIGNGGGGWGGGGRLSWSKGGMAKSHRETFFQTRLWKNNT